MKIKGRTSRKEFMSTAKFLSAVGALIIFLTGDVYAQGTAGLLDVVPGFPQVDAQGGGQVCSYDSGSMILTINSEPNLYFPDANTLDRINGGSLSMTVTLDGLGNVTSGAMTIGGNTDAGLTDPLLTANVDAIGLEDTSPNPGGIDRIDFRMTPTGGSIFEGPDWPAGFDLTANGTMINSNYEGSVASNWTCGDANLVLGAEFFAPPSIDVEIDVRPRCININGHGVVPVAIFGSDTFDVSEINRATLNFQGLDVNRRGSKKNEPQCGNEDVNGDGYTDLICQFEDDLDKWIPPENDLGELFGLLQDGLTMISGSDEICLVGKQLIDVPNVVDSLQEVAEIQLSADGLSVGTVTFQANAARAGTVIEQSPSACTDCANPGDPITLFVSISPDNTDGEGGGGNAMDLFFLAGLFFLALIRTFCLSGDSNRNL